MARWSLPPAIAIATRPSALPRRAACRKRRSPRRQSSWRARALAGKGSDDRSAHVGFYLIDNGLPELERAAGVEDSIFATLRRIGGRFPLPLYLGAIAVFVGHVHRGPRCKCLRRRRERGTPGAGHRAFPAGDESVGRGDGELAGDFAGYAAFTATNGFLRRHCAGITDAGGGSDDAHQRSRR